jgi:amino acid transporter
MAQNSERNSLRPDSVRLPGLIAQSIGSMGPELSATSIGAVAAAFAGASTPFAFVLGGLGGFALARIIALFSAEIADAGGIYAFVKRGIGPRSGFLLGWLYLGGLIIGLPAFLILSVVLLQEFLGAMMPHAHWVEGHWIVWILGMALVAFALSYIGVRLSVRILLALSAVGVASILFLDLVILAKGGAHGIVWSSLLPGHLSGVSLGHFGIAVGLGLTAFTGFEGAVYLAEESADAKRHVPRAVIGAFLGAFAFYLLTSLAMVTGYGSSAVKTGWPADSAGSVFTQSAAYLNVGFGKFLLLMISLAAFTAAVAVLNTCSRLLLAYARDEYLPRAFNRTHPRFKTPDRNLLAIAVVFIAICLGGLAWKGDGQAAALSVFTWLLLPAGVCLVTGLGSVAVAGGIVAYRRKLSVLRWLVEPLIALAVVVLGVFSNYYPAPPAPYDWAPYAAVLWLAGGTVLLIVFQLRNAVSGHDQPESTAGSSGLDTDRTLTRGS